MSTLKTTNLQHASAANPAIVLASDGTATAQLSSLNGGALSGARNRIINGDMRIDQRNAGASVSFNSSSNFGVDRFKTYNTVGSGSTVQRSTTAPSGFTNSLLLTVGTGASPGAADECRFFQSIEGFNVADLGFGTASASSVTISFQVRSSITGTYALGLRNDAGNRSYVATYTVNAANTWETKSVVIPGDTSGTWTTDNSAGIMLRFDLGSGSNANTTAGAWQAGNFGRTSGCVNWIATNGATFYITGVQVESGSVATPYERRSYGQELALCQRYYEKSYEQGTTPGASATAGSHWFTSVSTNVFSSVRFSVQKRSSPTISIWDTAGNANKASWGDAAATVTTNNTQAVIVQYSGDTGIALRQSNSIAGAVTVGYHWVASSEL